MLSRAFLLSAVLLLASVLGANGYEENRGYNRDKSRDQQQYDSNDIRSSYDDRQATFYGSEVDQTTSNKYQKSLFCYVNGTNIKGIHRQSDKTSDVQNELSDFDSFNLDYCTHLIIGAYVDNYYYIKGIDPQFKSKIIHGLKSKYSKLKVLLSLSVDPETFATMVRSPIKRSMFVANTAYFVADGHTESQFDGVVIDWQFSNGHPHSTVHDERQHIDELMTDLKVSLRSKSKLLAITLPTTIQDLQNNYKFDRLLYVVDYFIIMTMEYHGHQSKAISPTAPFHSQDGFNVVNTIEAIIRAIGSNEAYRLILAIPFYGKRYQLSNDIGTEESPIGKSFRNHQTPAGSGLVLYKHACLYKNSPPRAGYYWRYGWDVVSKTPWLVNMGQAILYEDEQSVREKAKLALVKDLGGVMAYTLNMDDYEGRCASAHRSLAHTDGSTIDNYIRRSNYDENRGKSPLLQAVHDVIKNALSVKEKELEETTLRNEQTSTENYDQTDMPNYDESNTQNYDQTNAPSYDQINTPNYDQKHTPNHDQMNTSSYDQEYTSNYDQKYTPSYDQRYTPSYDQEHTSNYDQTRTSSYDQNSTPSYNQRNTPNYEQEHTPSYNQRNTLNYNHRNASSYDHSEPAQYRSPTQSLRSIFCYINSTNVQNAHFQNFDLNSEEYKNCTHLVIGGAYLDRSYNIELIDPTFELSLTELKEKSHSLQILLSISGDRYIFASMARTPHLRRKFVQEIAALVRGPRNSSTFDGIVIDWYSAVTEEYQYFVDLIEELNNSIPKSDNKSLAIILPPTTQNIQNGYRFDRLMHIIDYFIIMAMEYHGHQSDRVLIPNAPIHSQDFENETLSVENTIDLIVQSLGPDNTYRLILAIPFYGKRYYLFNELGRGESPIGKPFRNHRVVSDADIVSYKNACLYKNSPTLNGYYWRYGWDPKSKTPWLVNGLQVILYEDRLSVRRKAALAFESGKSFSGVMVYSLDMDDYDGECAATQRPGSPYSIEPNDARSPLLKAVLDVIENGLTREERMSI